MGNGQTVLGSEMTSNAFKIIYDVELGKPNMFPKGQELRKG
jgi:hypothetical protein